MTSPNPIIAALILIGFVFANEVVTADEPLSPERRIRDGSHFGIPREFRDDELIKSSMETYRDYREQFRSEIRSLRSNLESAAESEKLAIRGQIRDKLMEHRREQRDFRKSVRRIVKNLRDPSVE